VTANNNVSTEETSKNLIQTPQKNASSPSVQKLVTNAAAPAGSQTVVKKKQSSLVLK